jgi:asparagine N-glycosylation enzyme membrane subunit Stt3
MEILKLNSKWLYLLGLIPVFIVALFVRTRNLGILAGKYLIELDSYNFFRYSKMLLENGSVSAIDMMRYVPIGSKTVTELFFPKTMVFIYKILHAFAPNLSQIEWHVIYPPIITVISLIIFFLFVKELFNSRTALVATAFLAVLPAYLYRTAAGFADHDAMGMLFMFISLWFFAMAWRRAPIYKPWLPISMMCISGLFTAMTAATFGSYQYLIYGISIFVLCSVILNSKIEPHQVLMYYFWMIVYLGIGYLLNIKYKLVGLPGEVVGFTALYLLVYLLLKKPLAKYTKVPYPLIPALLLAPGLMLVNIQNILLMLLRHNVARIFYTVSENAQPFFASGWWPQFGFIFIFAMAGSAICIYRLFQTTEYSKVKAQWWAAIAYGIFFSAFIFGRYADSSSPIVAFLSATYFYWLIGFLAFLAVLYLIVYYKDKPVLKEIGTKWPLLFMFVWFMIALLAARGQIRLLFMAAPPFAIMASLFINEGLDWCQRRALTVRKAAMPFLIMIAIAAIVVGSWQCSVMNSYMGSMTPGQWGDSMDWIRENTPENSVFAHWWDYGYLTLAVGERAVIADGGNERDWNYYLARYVMLGKPDTIMNESLTYMKSHEVTHLLYSSEEIPKYGAFAYIGDENGDRDSVIGVFGYQQQRETRDGVAIDLGGTWMFDQDYTLGQLIYTKQAAIVGFSIPIVNDSVSTAPIAHVWRNGQVMDFPITCLVSNGQRQMFQDGIIQGCLVPIGGGALWLSPKAADTLFARLYIYNEDIPWFKLVYQDEQPLAVYNGRIIGPIKIWELNYPENISLNPAMLKDNKYG